MKGRDSGPQIRENKEGEGKEGEKWRREKRRKGRIWGRREEKCEWDGKSIRMGERKEARGERREGEAQREEDRKGEEKGNRKGR